MTESNVVPLRGDIDVIEIILAVGRPIIDEYQPNELSFTSRRHEEFRQSIRSAITKTLGIKTPSEAYPMLRFLEAQAQIRRYPEQEGQCLYQAIYALEDVIMEAPAWSLEDTLTRLRWMSDAETIEPCGYEQIAQTIRKLQYEVSVINEKFGKGFRFENELTLWERMERNTQNEPV